MCSCFVSYASIFAPPLFLDLLLPVIPCHLFVGSHCYCYSSDKRLRLLLPGLGLAACPPLVVDLLLRFPCCSNLGSCHPALVVLVASKIQPQSRMGHAHQLGLHAVWPVLRRFSAAIPGRLLLSANRAGFCPILPFVYGCLNTLSINS